MAKKSIGSRFELLMNNKLWHIIAPQNQYTLFRKKRFEIDFFVQQKASKFAIFIEKENPHSFFRFSFRATLSFTL